MSVSKDTRQVIFTSMTFQAALNLYKHYVAKNNMPLKLLPLPRSEWDMYFRVCYTAFVPGIMDMMFPNGYSKEALQWSVDSLRRTDDNYPGRVHCIKVVDTDLPDTDSYDKIVGVSLWKIFPRERSEEEMQKEKEQSDKDDEVYGDPPGLDTVPIEDFGDVSGEYKKKHLGRKPHVLLQAIGTRPEHGRRGVGALSMKWGTEKADELGLPMYLEASMKGVGLYKRWGFETVDTLSFDARKHGYSEALTHLCMLRPPPHRA